MTFKQNTKMSASGAHYKCGGKVRKMNDGGSTGGTEPDPRDTANRNWAGQKKLLQMDVARSQSKDPIKRAANYVFGGSDAQSKIAAGDALANIREQQIEADLATKKKRGGKVCK